MTDQLDAATLARMRLLLDKDDIHEVSLRLCRSADRYDRALYDSCFWPEATIDVGEFCGDPNELWDWSVWLNQKAGGAISFHYILNYKCDVEGDDAHVEIYWLFTTREREENSWLAGGRYYDRFERRNGEWRIIARVNMIEWAMSAGTVPIPFPHPDVRVNGGPSPDRNDITYQRPFINKRPKAMPAGVPRSA